MESSRRLSTRAIAIFVALGTLVAACSSGSDPSPTSNDSTVEKPEARPLFQPAAAVGVNSFAPSMNATVLRVNQETLQSGVAGPDAPGLYAGPTYGGTGKQVCDVEKMIAFLTTHEDRGREWARVQGITLEQVPSFLRGLTPVYLQQNVALTMFGFKNGTAYGYSAVLEAGTAVLVDDKGLPRARCACGNPLVVEPPSEEQTTTTSTPDSTSTTVTIQECPEQTEITSDTVTALRKPQGVIPAGAPSEPDDSDEQNYEQPYYEYPYDDFPYDYPYDYPSGNPDDPCNPCPEDDSNDYPNGYPNDYPYDYPYDNYPNGYPDYYYDNYNEYPYDYPRVDPDDPCSPYIPPSVYSDCLPLAYTVGEKWLDASTGRIWTFNGMVNGDEEWESNGTVVHGVRAIPGYPWEKCGAPMPHEYPCPPEQPQQLDKYTGDPAGRTWFWVNDGWYLVTDTGLEGPVAGDQLPGSENCAPGSGPNETPGQPGVVVECPEREAPAGTLYQGIVNGMLVTYESLGVTDLLPDDLAEPFNYSAWRSSNLADGVLPTFSLPGYAENCLQIPVCPPSSPTPGDLVAVTNPDTGNRLVLIFVLVAADPAADGFDETYSYGGVWTATWGSPGEPAPAAQPPIAHPVLLDITGCLPPCPPVEDAASGTLWVNSYGEPFLATGEGRWKSLVDPNGYDSAVQMPGYLEDCGNPCANTDEQPRASAVLNSDGEPENPEGVSSDEVLIVIIDPNMSQGNGVRSVEAADPDDIQVAATSFDLCDPVACPDVDDLRIGDLFFDATGQWWFYDGTVWRTFIGDLAPVDDTTQLPGYERCLTGDDPVDPSVECPASSDAPIGTRVTLDTWSGVEWVYFNDPTGSVGWGRVTAGTNDLLDDRALSVLPYEPCLPAPTCPQLMPPRLSGDLYWPNTSVAASGEYSDTTAFYRFQFDATWIAYGFNGSITRYRDLSSIPSWIAACYEPACSEVAVLRVWAGYIFLGTDGIWYRSQGNGNAVKLEEGSEDFVHPITQRFADSSETVPLDSIPGIETCDEPELLLYRQSLVESTTTTVAPSTTRAPSTTQAPSSTQAPPISQPQVTPPSSSSTTTTTTSTTTTTTVTNPPPVVTIRSCSWSASGLDMTVDATDNTGVQSMTVTVNGTPRTISRDGQSWYVQYLTPNQLGGATTAQVIFTATDTQGKTGSLSFTARQTNGSGCS